VDRRYFVNSTAATGDTQDAENCIGSTAGNTQSAGVPNTDRSSDLYPLNSLILILYILPILYRIRNKVDVVAPI